MRASLESLLGRPVDFPVEITMSNGDKYVLPHPDHAHTHPNNRDISIYPEDGGLFPLVINPKEIVSFRKVRKARKAS
jgi:hypothetical protein